MQISITFKGQTNRFNGTIQKIVADDKEIIGKKAILALFAENDKEVTLVSDFCTLSFNISSIVGFSI